MTLSPASKKSKVVVILGPTASGKSALAVRLAKRFSARGGSAFGGNGAEIISADSRQVYRGLDIGSGKITKREMRGIRHHLLGVASPKRTFTVVQYQKLARRAVADIFRRGKLPIVCGGTGLYIDALLSAIPFPVVPPDLKLRAHLERETAEALFAKLQKLDPRRARGIDRRNKRHLIRALEIVLKTKKPVPKLQKRRSRYEVMKIGLRPSEEALKRNIQKRMHAWFRTGLLREVKHLHERGVSWKRLDDLGLTYRWANRYLRELISKDEMLRELEKDLWHYTKRQMTWWKRDKEIWWVSNERKAMEVTGLFLKEKSARRTARTDAR